MKTEFEILRLVDDDLAAAAKRDRLLRPSAGGRSHRRRVSWGGLVAASVAVLVVAGLVGMIATGGLGGSSDDAGKRARGTSDSAPAATGAGGETGGTAAVRGGSAPAAQPTTVSGSDQGFDYTTSPDDLAAIGGTGSPQQGELSKIVRDGSIAIRLDEGTFSQGFAAVTRVAQNNGGFVLTSSTTRQRAGSLVLRIPAKRFEQAMLALRELGVVERQRIIGRDVTAEFVDLTARLDILRQRRTLLLGLQADATTSAEILRLATLVERTQVDIERIQGQLAFLNDQVAEATIRVSLREANAPTGTLTAEDRNPSLGDAWKDAIHGFLSVVSAVVVGLGYVVPIGAIGLATWGVLVWVRRRRTAG